MYFQETEKEKFEKTCTVINKKKKDIYAKLGTT